MLRILCRRVLEILIFCMVFLFPFNFQDLSSYSTNKLITPANTATGDLNLKPLPKPLPNSGELLDKTTYRQALAVEPDNELPEPQPVVEEPPAPTAPTPQPATTTPPTAPIRYQDVQGLVAISFDDGPHPDMTAKYLQVLQEHNTQATFFMVGQQVKSYPQVAKLVVEQGSEIGSHSWRHAQMDKLTMSQILEDLQGVVDEVYTATGETLTLFRPPYGRFNDDLLAAAQKLNQQVVLWNVDPRDWENTSTEQIVEHVLSQVQPGSIILLHEGHPHTLEALPTIITELRARGLEPVSVSTLLEQNQQNLKDTTSVN